MEDSIGRLQLKVMNTFRNEMLQSLKTINEEPRNILGRLKVQPEYEDPV